jgi:DNA-binding response OmpR family regulator
MSQLQILIIEDDPVVARSLQAGLSREGFIVTWKPNGAQGIEYAQKASPHLVLLDIRLPDGSGFDFCRQMRQLGLRQPVIMLTARYEQMDKVLGLEMGADDYVTKPFGLRELASRVRAQLLDEHSGTARDAQGKECFPDHG